MRALVVHSPHDVALETLAEPITGDDEVLVAPLLAGMCGTDLELIDASIDPAYVHYPLTLGHEWVGQVLDDVPGVASHGDRVVVEGVIPCGDCDECLIGATNRCTTYDEIGFTRAGALAERVNVPASLVHRLNDEVDLRDAVLVEPMSVVWRVHAAEDGRLAVTDIVVEGVSMTITQRSEYNSLLQGNGGKLDALLALLRSKVDQMKVGMN